jgi:hypothetical protein
LELDLTAGEQPTTAAMLESFPGRVSRLKISGRTQGTLWWRCLHKKVTGVTPATMTTAEHSGQRSNLSYRPS